MLQGGHRLKDRSSCFEQAQPGDPPPWPSRQLEIQKHTEVQARSQGSTSCAISLKS